MNKRQHISDFSGFALICAATVFILVFICSHPIRTFGAGPIYKEANDLFNQGDYDASLKKYEQILEQDPKSAGKTLFEMGVIYSYPKNRNKDYQKSLACFEKLVKEYPESEFRRDSQMMIFQINNVILKDGTIARQHAQIENLKQDIRNKESEIKALRAKIEILENKVFNLRKEPADRILIEKKERKLTLLSKGEVIKIYRIALGGNPVGPKEKQGDNKTPEGIYTIDGRNRDSGYHLSLHVSYPNENDRKRAKESGVSPGGDIMIHGNKNGMAWIGGFHSEIDWTKGCIAVTDQEIEEIDRLVPNGTIVEILP